MQISVFELTLALPTLKWQMCVENILARSAPPPDNDVLKTILMPTNMKNDIFHLISTTIIPKVLTLSYPV